MTDKEIIKLQQEAIDIYKDTFKFISKVTSMVVKDEQIKLSSQRNNALLDLAWSTNDCITDQPRLREIHEKLKQYNI